MKPSEITQEQVSSFSKASRSATDSDSAILIVSGSKEHGDTISKHSMLGFSHKNEGDTSIDVKDIYADIMVSGYRGLATYINGITNGKLKLQIINAETGEVISPDEEVEAEACYARNRTTGELIREADGLIREADDAPV